MAKNCKACKDLESRDVKVDCFEVNDEVCKSLKENKGFNGKADDCKDMHDLNDCLLGRAEGRLKAEDDCNWRDYMARLIPTLYNLIKMLICAICGLWDKIKEFERQFWEINTQYEIKYSTPEMSVSINRSTGDFVFKFSDWVDPKNLSTRVGRGIVTGTVNFGMRHADSGFDWQIRDVKIDKFQYIPGPVKDSLGFKVFIYVKNDKEQLVYSRSHDNLVAFTDNINKTIPINMKGTVKDGETSGWIQFLEVYNRSLSYDQEDRTGIDDRANVQIEFKNTKKSNPPAYK